jgi:hypothetical protein
MDSYIKETQRRYIEDSKRHNAIQGEIEKLRDEAQKLGGKLNAYSRILKDALGDEVVRKLDEEIETANNAGQSKVSMASSSNPISITNAILMAVKEGGSEGITAAQVINKVEELGFGPEKRNTIYGILSRLKTNMQIKKSGNHYSAN